MERRSALLAFLRKKDRKKNGKTYSYYSIVESYRDDDGKPRQRTLLSIGDEQALKDFALDCYSQLQNSANTALNDATYSTYSHGAGMAMYWMAEEIGIEKIMSDVFRDVDANNNKLPERIIKGMPRSRILLLGAIHRAVDPGSKRAFEEWVKYTSLPYYLNFDPEDFTSQTFWEAMDGITEDQIHESWRQIVQRTMDRFGIDLSTLALDYSNYFTFISSKNGRCVICQRGHNKQKRDDLRQFSVAATTSFNLQIPLFWTLYQGNINDTTEFPEFVTFVKAELAKLEVDLDDITLCFDGGSNSEDNFKDLGIHIICAHSIPADLYEIGLENYEEISLDNGKKRLAYRIDEMAFSGISGVGVLTHSQALEDGQVADLDKKLKKAEKTVDEMRERLKNPKSRLFTELNRRISAVQSKQREAVEYNKEIDKEQQELAKSGQKKRGRAKKKRDIPVLNLAAEMRGILENKIYDGLKILREFTSVTVNQDADGIFTVDWTIDEDAKAAYCAKYFGKKLTCTDRIDWSTRKILQEYANQECIENGVFKISKDTDHFCVRPVYHWTDQKIWVHMFICMEAIAIAEILRMELENRGITITRPALMDKLAHVHDGWIILADDKLKRVTAQMNDDVANIWNTVLDIFGK